VRREVRLLLRETAGLGRALEPVRIGVPLPRGLLGSGAPVSVLDDQARPLPLQARCLSRWSDGSVQWLLVDVLASVAAHGSSVLRLCLDALPAGVGAHPGLRVEETADHLRIDTGVAVFEVSRAGPGLLGAVRLGEVDLLSPAGLQLRLAGADGAECAVEAVTTALEESGPVRCTLRMEGRVGAARGDSLLFVARLVFHAGSRELCCEFRLRNPRAAVHPGGLWDLGDPGSVQIADLSLRLEPAAPAQRLSWCAEPGSPPGESSSGDWLLHQDSSGGECWDSPNHVTASGDSSVSFRGYRVSEGRGAAARVVASGERATPVLQWRAAQAWVAVAVEDFWQNFPKALRRCSGGLEVGLFPRESRTPVELQGGEQKRHAVWFGFGTQDQPCRLAERLEPLQACVDPAWIESTEAVPFFTAAAPDDDPRLRAYVDTLVEGPASLQQGRERIDEFGWRNFGEVHADHEAVNAPAEPPFVSHYNNQYDVVLAAAVQGLRAGDARWLELMRACARHVIDIDIYHTTQDKAAFNGGLFWHTDHYRPAQRATHRTYSRLNAGAGSYGGGPSSEHCYTTGLLHYYFMTGDPEAAEAVRSLADWVVAMDDGSLNLFGLVDPGPTGAASQTASLDYHKAGRGAGNSINALLDAYALRRERGYLAKAEQLIQRCIHPADDVAALGLAEPECRWSYLVFLQALGRYLERKLELGEVDYHFHYARESLLHYADWMRVHEVPYRDVLHKVLIPSETWPAHDLRKAQVLFVAARFLPAGSARDMLRERATFFAGRCLDDVLGFASAFLVRPRILVAVHAGVERYFRERAALCWDGPPHVHDFGSPQPFLPQRARLRATLAAQLRVAGADARRQWRSKWLAWRRRGVLR
jgi:hypothetical protein